MRAVFFALVIACLLVGLIFPLRAPARQEPIAGYIDKVQGVAYLRTGAQRVRLDPKRDARRALHPGEIVWCGRGGYLRLKLACGEFDSNRCKPKEIRSSKQFPIPPLVPPRTDRERERQESVQEYGRSGGRPMGALSPVFSPSSDSTVRPGNLVIRWIPGPALSSFSLKIQNMSHATVWEQKVADGTAGYLTSESLRQALTEYRNEQGKGSLVLELEDKNHIGSQLRFSLLSMQEEQDLDKELAEWNNESDVFLRHLGRAHSFFIRNMFAEVAEEFETALAETPDSRDLLIRTITAHRDTGNSIREEELKRRLPSGTSVP